MHAAIFSCEDAPKWEGWTELLWSHIVEGDLTTFRCYNGEFPDVATCRERFDVIVVGGSHHSAYDDLPWIRQLEQLLPQYVAAGVRVVGCCFGHQILAKALGGTVGKNPSGRFVLGVEDVAVDRAAAGACGLQLPVATRAADARPTPPTTPTPAADAAKASPPAASSAAEASGPHGSDGRGASRGRAPAGGGGPADAAGPGPGPGASQAVCPLRMIESHGDQVLTLPPGATLLASSGTCAHEMWALGDRCLAFQFHPELTPEVTLEKIWTALSESGRLSPEEAARAERQLKAGTAGVDSGVFWKALRTYLRAPPPEPLRSARPAAASPGAAAADAAAAAAQGGVQAAAAIRQDMERRAGQAAEDVLGHVRQAAAAGMAAGTSSAELLTSLNREAAGAYGSAVVAAQETAELVVAAVATQQEPLKAALASLGALEAQLDRLAAVVGTLEHESVELEEEAVARSKDKAAEPGAQGAG